MTTSTEKASVDQVLADLARLAAGRTGADVEQAVRTAKGRARRAGRGLTIADLEASLVEASPPLTGPLRRRFAVHEAGHAIVAMVLGIGTVESIMIDTTGGTTHVRRDAMRDQDEQYFLDELTMTMAGRAAEAEILGSVGAGSGGLSDSDLDHATRLAAALEGSLGYGARHPLLFMSEEVLQIRLLNDREFAQRVHQRIEAAEARARDIIRHERPAVADLADRLGRESAVEKVSRSATLRP
jgi:cell division protease FtsH